MRQHFLFPIIFGLGCLAANDNDLFSDVDNTAAIASVNGFDAPIDALSPLSNDAYDSLLLADSSDDYPDVLAIDRFSEVDGDSDLGAPAASPFRLSLDGPESPSEFHDEPPGSDGAPVCEYPRLAACCIGGDLRSCIWYKRSEAHCDDEDDFFCCEQVTPEGQGRNCEIVSGWPSFWFERILDILRVPAPLPEGLNGGVWIPE